jgi:DNA/RNA-binding domain of Phe-tRNA-synthetase-like protein
MDESAYSTLLKYVENTEYTENLTESEKSKLMKQAKHYVSKDKLWDNSLYYFLYKCSFLKEPAKKDCCELNFKCFIFSIFQYYS